MVRRLVLALPCALVALLACNALSGVDTLGVGEASSDRDGPARTGEGGAGTEGGADPGDGGAVVTPTPTLAACGDASVCMPNTNGWSPAVNLAFAFGDGCPAEWPQRTDDRTPGGGTCACDCKPIGGSCDGPVQMRTGSACGGAALPLSFAPDGGCTNTTPNASPLALTADPAELPTSCTGTVQARFEPSSKTVTCTGATMTASAACDPGEVCVPKPTGGKLPIPTAAVCMVHDGEVGCPQQLPHRIVVGSSVSDGRSCAASCACAPSSSCNEGKLEAFSDATCTNRVRTYDVDGTCNPSKAILASAFRYTAGSACKVSQPALVVGTQTVTAPRTLCCQLPFAF